MSHPFNETAPKPTEVDQRPKRLSWAPGGYSCECFECNRRFIGDKRAMLCAPCAYMSDETDFNRRKILKRIGRCRLWCCIQRTKLRRVIYAIAKRFSGGNI